jgi:hypothetical protein
MLAFGAEAAAALARSRTIEALVLKRSSRVIPGLRGTPAGMRTISAPVRASFNPDGVGWWPVTYTTVNEKFFSIYRGRNSYLAVRVDVANVSSDTCEISIVSARHTPQMVRKIGSVNYAN